ncbi:hypothetical protein OIU79_007649 [Salix purpurea]|uniref:Uncharacterized protein n=1 Tax=Salix purpurea TaxID=77065 RepID=A0A9Q0YVB7_SALPP|nr:hypothetical protein OIU79_007649 [Salix purpurea]KAJ6711239.1 hypothetical protein OIU79_007649 [Salix purpurea]
MYCTASYRRNPAISSASSQTKIVTDFLLGFSLYFFFSTASSSVVIFLHFFCVVVAYIYAVGASREIEIVT